MKRAFVTLVITAVVGVASAAHADVSAPPKPHHQCATPKGGTHDSNYLAVGERCAIEGTSGTCQAYKCRAKGSGPDGAQSDCTLCTTDDGVRIEEHFDTKLEVVPPAPGTSSSSGCSAAPLRAVGPWLLALAVPAIVLGLRRRKN